MRSLMSRLDAALFKLVGVAAGQVAATVTIGLAAGATFRSAAMGEPVDGLAAGALGVAAAATIALRYFERVQAEAYSQGVVHGLRRRLAHHLMRLPVRGAGTSRDELLLRFVGDLSAIRAWRARGVIGVIIGAPTVVAATVALAVLDWRIGGAVAALIAISLGLQTIVAPGLRETGREARRLRGRLAAAVSDGAEGLPALQMLGRTRAQARLIDKRSTAVTAALRKRASWSGLMRSSAELAAAGLPVVTASVWVFGGGIDVGAGSAALALGGLLAPRLREIARAREYWELARIAQERVDAFLALPTIDERRDAKSIARREGRLSLRKVRIDGVIEQASAEARPGSRVALVGGNGAGKSRLLGVIAGLECPAGGRVVIDGQNVGVRRLSSLRRLVALAGDDAPLLRGTVEANAHCGARTDGAQAALIRATTGYDALTDILPQGGATRVGVGGQGISAGQRARVALTRALMRHPLVLLLDEIDANLDEEGEAALSRVFYAFEGTIIFATHDPAWIERCDTVWRIERGMLAVNARGEEKEVA